MIRGPLIDARELTDPALRLLDARVDAEAYARGHVHGAVRADLERDLSASGDPSDGGRHPLPPIERWAETLGRWGIEPTTPVAIYDDRGGALAAARAWWMLEAVGHRHVAVVDGGWAAIREAGVAIDAEAPSAPSAPPYPVERWMRPTVSLEDVATRGAERLLVDVRASERFRGETEPLDPVAGHIPGAVNLPFVENLDDRGHFLSAGALRTRYEAALAGRRPEDAIVSCGSGVTACHGLLALAHAGLEGAALYVGSWSEWCRRNSPT